MVTRLPFYCPLPVRFPSQSLKHHFRHLVFLIESLSIALIQAACFTWEVTKNSMQRMDFPLLRSRLFEIKGSNPRDVKFRFYPILLV
jgi:hypothetical protein